MAIGALSAWTVTEKVLPHSTRILLYGPPGTGKTSLAYADGGEPEVIQCHEETSVAEIIGHFVPVGDRFVWLDGPALSAWRHGKRLLIDEIDLASGPVLSVMRGICNDPLVARIRIPNPALAELGAKDLATAIATGKALQTLKPGAGFQVIATMNGVPEDLDEPLADRFPVKQFIPYPHPNAILSLPEDLQTHAKKSTRESDANRRIGIRAWKAYAELRELVGEDLAAKAVFDSRAGDILDAVKLATPDKKSTWSDTDTELRDPEADPAIGGAVAAAIDAAVAALPSSDALEEAYAVRVEAGSLEKGASEVRPRAYSLKTGKRGRPPRAVCPRHGNMTHKNATISATGNLMCKRCATLGVGDDTTVIASAGTFTAVEKIATDEDGKPVWVKVIS